MDSFILGLQFVYSPLKALTMFCMFDMKFDSEGYGCQLIQCVSEPMPIDQGNYAYTPVGYSVNYN